MKHKRQSLNKVLGRFDVLAMAFGTMIGWGWVMLVGNWVSEAGVVGAISAFLIGAVMCIFVGLTYAELTPALPLAGGEMVFAYRGLNYFWSWVTSWAIGFAYVGVAAMEGISMSTAIDYIFHIPKMGLLWTIAGYDVYLSWAIIGIAGAIVITTLNYFGTKNSAIFQVMGTVGLVLVGLLFLFGGVAFGSTEYAVPLFTSGSGLVAVLLMAPSMYVGFDVIPQTAEEMNIPLKQIANVLIISILMAAAWYILMIVGISISAPAEIRQAGGVPVADAMAFSFNSPIFGKILIGGALCGILTSWNGFIMGATRVLFAMGRAKMIPAVFAKLHPKYNSPTGAILLVGLISCLSPLLGKNALVWFVDASAFGTVVAYLLVSISFISLRKKEPNLERPFKVSSGKFVGYGAVIISLVFISLYLPIGPGSLVWPYEWGIVFAWMIIGIVLAIWAKRSYGNISKAEREFLIFGKHYARKEIVFKKES
ncbi:MAG: APC family permease [Clostridium sp.]|uniref:APC family permease n=1 Tax=Clostridium sp. TaxID=1506 RepID=UPI003D6D265F